MQSIKSEICTIKDINRWSELMKWFYDDFFIGRLGQFCGFSFHYTTNTVYTLELFKVPLQIGDIASAITDSIFLSFRRLREVGTGWFVITYSIFLLLDDSGRWGQGGLFSALSRRSSQPETQYELAGRMKGLFYNVLHQFATAGFQSESIYRERTFRNSSPVFVYMFCSLEKHFALYYLACEQALLFRFCASVVCKRGRNRARKSLAWDTRLRPSRETVARSPNKSTCSQAICELITFVVL